MSTVTSLGFSIFSRYDGSGVRRANRDVNQLQRNLNRSSSGLNNFTGRMGALVTASAALGPALSPVGAVLTGLAGGFVAATAAAAAAGGIYGAVTMGAVKSTLALSKKLTTANTALNTQKATLSKMKPGTQAYAAQLLKVRDAQGKVNAAMAGLGPVQRTFLDNTEKLKGAWQGFITQTSGATLGPINTVMTVAIKHMQDLVPLVRAVGGLAQEVANKFKRWADSGGLTRFIHILRTDGVSGLALFMGITVRLLSVMGTGFRAFLPIGHQILVFLLRGSEALKQWADGGGFTRFLSNVQKNGPAVGNFFRALWGAVRNVTVAMGALGPLSLGLTTLLLKLVAALPPSWIQAIVVGFLAFRAVMVSMAIISAVTAIVGGLQVALGTLNLVLAALGITWNVFFGWVTVIILAVAALTVAIVLLVKHWSSVWNAIKTVSGVVFRFLTHGLGQLALLLLGPVGALAILALHWHTVWYGIRSVGLVVWRALKVAWQGTVNFIVSVMRFMGRAGSNIWRSMQHTFSAVMHAMSVSGRAIWSGMRTVFTNIWRSIQRTGSSIFSAIRTTAVRVFHAMAGTLKSIWSGIVSAAKSSWNKVRSVVRTPIAFVINHVIAPLARTFNSIAKAVHIGLHVPVPKFASGGHVRGPGTGRSDSIPAMLSNNEYVMPAHTVRKYGVGFFDSLRSGNAPQATEKMGFQGQGLGAHALGGWIPDPIKNIGKAVLNTLVPGAKGLMDTFGSWTAKFISGTLMKGVNVAAGAIPGGGLIHDVAKAGAKSLIKGAVDMLFKQNNEAGGPIGGNIPKGARLALLRRALGLTHTPPPGTLSAWLKGLNTLITRESGWNAGAINRTDSNAKAGHPSQGLMQTIPSTFNAYKLPGHNNIRNGLDNVIAGIRYIKARYGNITKVQQANANAAPKGYSMGGMVKMVANSFDRGGYLPKGLSLAYNGTGRPEPVGHHLGGGYSVEFNNCTFGGGTSKREVEKWVVQGLTEAERKGRIPRRRG